MRIHVLYYIFIIFKNQSENKLVIKFDTSFITLFNINYNFINRINIIIYKNINRNKLIISIAFIYFTHIKHNKCVIYYSIMNIC